MTRNVLALCAHGLAVHVGRFVGIRPPQDRAEWPPRHAPKQLLRASRVVVADAVSGYASSVAAFASYDYARGASALAAASDLVPIGRLTHTLVRLCGGHPPRHRYASRTLRTEAKRFRTGHMARRARWEARGGVTNEERAAWASVRAAAKAIDPKLFEGDPRLLRTLALLRMTPEDRAQVAWDELVLGESCVTVDGERLDPVAERKRGVR